MKLRPFELALVIIFVVFVFAALLLLTMSGPKSNDQKNTNTLRAPVVIWGTLPQAAVDTVLSNLTDANKSFQLVSYRHIDDMTFDTELTTALADGVGPDLILTSHEQLVDQRHRLQPFDYKTFPLRDFRSRYLDGAEIYALADGIYGLPIAVDPLMLYYNRDILSNAGFLTPPVTWEELVTSQFPDLIQKDFDRTIYRSVVAFGEYKNVRNALGVLSALMLQAGSAGVEETTDGSYLIGLHQRPTGEGNPLRIAADFYARFSNPGNTMYSWNRSFKEDRAQFVSEDLVFYFGYGSEARALELLNPNLRFDIAELPQDATATNRRTYGRFYGLSMLRSSDNQGGSLAVMSKLGTSEVTTQLAAGSGMVPPYRTIVAVGSDDTYGRLTYASAAISYGWLNPNLVKTNEIFATMTSDINENRQDISGATSDVLKRLELEYN